MVGRSYDGAPLQLSFPQLELRENLLPMSRYYVKNQETHRLVSVPYSMYCNLGNAAMIQVGILEVLAQEVTMASAALGGLISTAKVIVPPRIVAHANAWMLNQ